MDADDYDDTKAVGAECGNQAQQDLDNFRRIVLTLPSEVRNELMAQLGVCPFGVMPPDGVFDALPPYAAELLRRVVAGSIPPPGSSGHTASSTEVMLPQAASFVCVCVWLC